MSTRDEAVEIDVGDHRIAGTLVKPETMVPGVLLVHGFTGAKEDFADEVDRLAARGFHVVAPEHRGHGRSAQPDDEAAY